MQVAVAAFAFAPGLALGSFLNVVAARVPARRSIVTPASSCGACGTTIAWRDNIPVLSYLLLRGRCRSCGARISPLYPAVELLTAALVAACGLVFGLSAYAVLAAGFCAVLVALSVIDFRHRIIPNRIVVPAAAVALVVHTGIHVSPQWTLCALGASGFLFVTALVYPAGMGMGDVKLAFLMGAVLGKTVPVAMLTGMVAALVPSAVLIVRHGAAGRKMGIPFGPFLAFGSIVSLFAGHAILDLYLSLY
jgi:leader peptidase (prepilin peptidase)/N-methyltransferase